MDDQAQFIDRRDHPVIGAKATDVERGAHLIRCLYCRIKIAVAAVVKLIWMGLEERSARGIVRVPAVPI